MKDLIPPLPVPGHAAALRPRLPLRLSEEVADALAENRPVVALESNVITHGLPWPANAETARAVETAVRRGGAVPATVFVLDGEVRIGAEGDLIDRFATTKGLPKLGNRDLPVVLAQGGAGATTVASSLICAEAAGIAFFASAGIGGVHRGGETSLDISADLIQFTRSRVAMVCAGAKTILDLPRTLEVLETQGVPLVAFRSDDFPAFYCESSGLRSPHRMDDPAQVARLVALHFASGLPGGVLITTPPRPEEAIPADLVETALAEALAAAEAQGITGNGLTKFLMHAIDKATGGRSARANSAVLISTAETAGLLASAYAPLQSELARKAGHA